MSSAKARSAQAARDQPEAAPSKERFTVRSRREGPYPKMAREVVRAIRGRRSQAALAKRLGYTSNPLTDWERGVRHPAAVEVLRLASVCRLPVREAFVELLAIAPPAVVDRGPRSERWVLHTWLTALRGSVSNSDLARRLGVSRYTVSRWCSGHTQPKLHEFLHVVDALTGRVDDWVAALVPISQVPSLLPRYEQAVAARTVAVEHPWSEAILRVLETRSYREHPQTAHATLAATLGVSEPMLQAALDGLLKAGVIAQRQHPRTGQAYYVALRELSVDTRRNPGAVRRLQRHWLSVALARAEREAPDWGAYNVVSCSEADFERLRTCLRKAFRESRSIVATSQPCETAGMLVMQLVRW